MRKYTELLDCRNISTAGAKMYGYSNLPSLSGKKKKAVRHQKVNSYNGHFFFLFFNIISATAFEIAAKTVNILLLLMKNISWLKREKMVS